MIRRRNNPHSQHSSLASLSLSLFAGPKAQLKAMLHSNRRIATLLYLGTLGATLGIAFGLPNDAPGKTIGIFACVILQFCALVWYTLSYIPFARDIAKKVIARCFSS